MRAADGNQLKPIGPGCFGNLRFHLHRGRVNPSIETVLVATLRGRSLVEPFT